MLYRGYGLHIESEVELLGLGSVSSGKAPDLTIAFSDVQHNLANETWSRICCKSNASQFLLDLEVIGAGKAMAREGCQILLDRQWSEKPGLLHKALMEDLMAAILMQRKTLSFFGTALALGGEHCLILGPPAIGKSTLAAHLCDEGYSLVADGVCAVRVCGESVSLLCGNRRMKLWADAVERLGWSIDSCKKLRPGLEKYLAPEDPSSLPAKAKLTRIYIMDLSKNTASPSTQLLKGTRAVQFVTQFVAAPTFYQAWFLSVLGPMINGSTVYALDIPRAPLAIAETTADIVALVKSQEGL